MIEYRQDIQKRLEERVRNTSEIALKEALSVPFNPKNPEKHIEEISKKFGQMMRVIARDILRESSKYATAPNKP